jgi:hypothetical protein
MLYKNLPEKDLDHVMRVRLWLDYIAAIKELLTGKFGDFKAIIKARRDFYKWKADFAAIRCQIQALRQTNEDQNISNFSILQKYYIFRKKTYDKIS